MKIFTNLFLFLLMIVGPLAAAQAVKATDSPSASCGCFRGKRGPTGPTGPSGPSGPSGPFLSEAYLTELTQTATGDSPFPVGFEVSKVIAQNILVTTLSSDFSPAQELAIGFSPQETGFYRVTAAISPTPGQDTPELSTLIIRLGGNTVATAGTFMEFITGQVDSSSSFVIDAIIQITSLVGKDNEIQIRYSGEGGSVEIQITSASLVITKVG